MAATLPVMAGTSERDVRFATFNASLNRAAQGELITDLSTTTDIQAQAVAEIIQRTRPDVLLINEFDFDDGDVAVDLFQDNYLSMGQNGADPIEYPYRMGFASNTGVLSGFDLNNDGITAAPDDIGTASYANDSWGFGLFPGQFAFAVYSMYPIAEEDIRTFQHFLWQDMPGALLPDRPGYRRVVLLRGDPRPVPAVLEEPRRRAHRDRRQDGPLPGQSSHASGLRWP